MSPKARQPMMTLPQERAFWKALRVHRLMPARGPSGSIRNRFRTVAYQTACKVVADTFDGDVEAFLQALDRQWRPE